MYNIYLCLWTDGHKSIRLVGTQSDFLLHKLQSLRQTGYGVIRINKSKGRRAKVEMTREVKN